MASDAQRQRVARKSYIMPYGLFPHHHRKENSPITSGRSPRAAAQGLRAARYFFQSCSILDRNSPRIDGWLKPYWGVGFHFEVCLTRKPRGGDSHEGHNSLVHLDSSGCNYIGSLDQQLYCPLERAEKLCLQAAQKDFRGEAIERNEAYESFSAACYRTWEYL